MSMQMCKYFRTSFSTNAEIGVFFVLFLRFRSSLAKSNIQARAVSVCYDLYTTIEYPHIGRYTTIGEVRDDQ